MTSTPLLGLLARRDNERIDGYARASSILFTVGLIAFVPWAIFDSYVELALNSET